MIAAPPTAATEPGPKPRGFAAISADRRREIAAKGGKAAHAAGAAHTFTSDEAKAAGKKGGSAPHVRRGPLRRSPLPHSQTGD